MNRKLLKIALVVATINLIVGLTIPIGFVPGTGDPCQGLTFQAVECTESMKKGDVYRAFPYEQRRIDDYLLDNIIFNFIITGGLVYFVGSLFQKTRNPKQKE